MASNPAFLLSMLARQLMLGEAGFRKRYPDSWVLWESGDTGQTEPADLQDLLTRLPRARYPERPASGDPLCFSVAGGAGTVIDVGRAVENGIVIGEASVSRMHCRLTKHGSIWQLTRVAEAMPMSVDHHPVGPDQVVTLTSRHELVLGNVLLTFHSTASLIERLQGVTRVEPAAGQ